MVLRVLILAGGLLGAAATSQYPEFAQQYTQRLGGEVAGLTSVLEDFDASAARADLTREEALASMSGSAFQDNRRKDMERTIVRQERLSGDLEALQNAAPMERLLLVHRVRDIETARATFETFRPAVPLTLEGAISAGAGFFLGRGLFWVILGLLARPFRRRRPRY